MNWAAVDFTGVANAFLGVVIAAMGALAVWIGRRAKPPIEARQAAAVEMQGAAIISNEPLQMLVRAIEAGNVEGMQLRVAVGELTEAIGDQTEELKEMRREMALKR